MKRLAFLPVVLLLVVMAACSSMLENEYSSITPVVEPTPEPERDMDELEAANYEELKNAVIWLVRSGRTEGNVRLRGYTGNVNSDVNRVCRDVWHNEPIGNYALDYISSEVTRIIAQYDVAFTLTYRRTYAQIQDVEEIAGSYRFGERLLEIMSDFGSGMVFETNLYYNDEQFQFEQEKTRIYYDNPGFAQGLPGLEVKFYPETGLRRIVELKLTYPDSTDRLREQELQSRQAAENIVAELPPELTDAEKALELYKALGDICTFDHELYNSMADGLEVYPTTYDAFFDERVLPESYALAYKLLCDIAGIPCKVIVGQRGADEHVWNLIQLDGNWYHADLSADDMGDTLLFEYFLVPDSVMLVDYRWKTSAYPAAEGGDLTYEAIAITEIEP